MTAPPLRYVRRATVERPVDGDTVALLVDMGFSTYVRFSCRVMLDKAASIDTPERGHRGVKEASAAAAALLPVGTRVTVESLSFTDKFGGRFDGRVWLPDGEDFAAAMLATGYALPWPLGQPKPFPRTGEPARAPIIYTWP